MHGVLDPFGNPRSFRIRSFFLFCPLCIEGERKNSQDICHTGFQLLEEDGLPVCGKCNEYDKADHFRYGAIVAATRFARGICAIAAWFVFDVNGDQRNRKPCAEKQRNESTDEADHENMTKVLRYIHGRLQHYHSEGYPWDPAYKADDAEDAEQCKDNGSRVVMSGEIVYGCCNAEHDV